RVRGVAVIRLGAVPLRAVEDPADHVVRAACIKGLLQSCINDVVRRCDDVFENSDAAQIVAIGAKSKDFSHGVLSSRFVDRSLSYSLKASFGNRGKGRKPYDPIADPGSPAKKCSRSGRALA